MSRSSHRILSAASSHFLASAPGGDVIHVLPRSKFSASHEVPSASYERHRSVSGGHCRNFLGQFFPRGSSVVVRLVQSSSGPSVRPSTARPLAIHRRFRHRLGSVSGGFPSVRLVASRLFSIFHQSPGTSSCALRRAGFSPSSQGSINISVLGQHHGPVLSKESRGNAFFDSQCGGTGHSEALREQPSSSYSTVHSGPPECSCRLFQSSFTGSGIRVDPLLSGASRGPSPLAGNDRSLCEGSE